MGPSRGGPAAAGALAAAPVGFRRPIPQPPTVKRRSRSRVRATRSDSHRVPQPVKMVGPGESPPQSLVSRFWEVSGQKRTCGADGSGMSRPCKPGSVRRSRLRRGDHFSGTALARRLERPTREAWLAHAAGQRQRLSYLVFLRVGLAVPDLSPSPRCALTAPFHPYRATLARRPAVCFLWRFPWPRDRLPLATTLTRGARTFLPLGP